MWINLAPLKKHRDFRYLFLSQTVSFLGSMVSYVAAPYQVFELTQSSLQVGYLSLVQLVPLLIFGLIGGQVADRMDRRRVLLICETAMGLCAAGLVANSLLPHPSVGMIFALTAILQATNGFHRPALDALTQGRVDAEDYGAIGALGSLRYSGGAILGPALGGILVSTWGPAAAYLFDLLTFGSAVFWISKVAGDVRDTAKMQWHPKALLENMKAGFDYAMSRQELLGTYFVDIAAMTFAFPVALFPEMSKEWGGAKATGILYSAMSVGSLIMSLVSGWFLRIKTHGRMVILAASLWGLAMVGMGFSGTLWVAVIWLVLAGIFDTTSGLFRGIIWNETIPNDMRGRMSSIEMISYMSGPLLGNARAGWMAAEKGWNYSVSVGGGIACIAVMGTALFLRGFWRYRSKVL
jgi:MFS family permease